MGTDWITAWSRNESLRFIAEVSSLLKEQGGPLTSEICNLIEKGSFADVVNFKFDYTSDFLPRDFQIARQAQALLSKQGEWLDLGFDPTSKGREKFLLAEAQCRETNDRLDSSRPHGLVSVVSHYAQRKITEVLGDVPSISDLMPSFGPGANTSIKGSLASPKSKFTPRLACSEDMLPFVGDFLAEVPLWVWSQTSNSSPQALFAFTEEVRMYPEIEIHDGKLVFVPKDARSKRAIVVEPPLNGFFQKGVGTYIRNRLLQVAGQNLRDQWNNRVGAYLGSINGYLATVDLSMASDTVALLTVFEMLPLGWAEFLSKLRTPAVTDQGTRVVLEKFSSMGNAFTFELESLIFYSFAYGVCRALDLPLDQVSIYGDDIIIPAEGYPLLIEVLAYYGFTTNVEKSYATGPFRESCGADWLGGLDIRPFYLRDKMSERSLYTFHNWAMRSGERELASFLLSWTKVPIQLWGPDGYGDGHLVGSHVLRSSRKMKRCGWEGGVFDTYVLNPKRVKTRGFGDWVYPSYSTYVRGEGSRLDFLDPSQNVNPDTVRGSNGYSKVSVYTLATSIFGR